jgi:hypothetical protein
MSEYGLKVWDASGNLILSGVDETMRIVTTVQVRMGSLQYMQQISVPLARAGMYALVQCIHPYTAWPSYTSRVKRRSSVPSVRVLDGAIQLYSYGSSRYWANVDIILVAT